MKIKKRKLSLISSWHYVKLFYRSVLFFAAAALYIYARVKNLDGTFSGYEKDFWLLGVIFTVYAVEMACRFFPSRFESMGCQRQFKRNYVPTGEADPQLQSPMRTASVAIAWLLLNGAIGALYYIGLIDAGILVLISLAYGVCDMICILFFCPFQTWFMKNRCCTVCRIYNWDYAMMFTPFIFIKNLFTWSLLGISLVLLICWEISIHRHPERFSDKTNACVTCKECKEKLCHHKRQLRSFWDKNKARFKFK